MVATLRKILQISLILTITCVLGACMSWQQLEPLTPERSAPFVLDSTQTYLLHLGSGDTLIVRDAHVEGDSVVWFDRVSAGTYWVPRRTTIPIASIRSASIQRASVGGTIGFLLLAIALAGMVVASGEHYGLGQP